MEVGLQEAALQLAAAPEPQDNFSARPSDCNLTKSNGNMRTFNLENNLSAPWVACESGQPVRGQAMFEHSITD